MRVKNFITEARGMFFTAVILAAMIVLFTHAVNGASVKADSAAAASLETAIKRAAVQCYAIEGFYPPGAAYLEEHYGIIVDAAKFIVEYNCPMPNTLPIVKVLY